MFLYRGGTKHEVRGARSELAQGRHVGGPLDHGVHQVLEDVVVDPVLPKVPNQLRSRRAAVADNGC